MEQERTSLGSQLTERLESRLVRRPRIGFSPGFYERFGFADPWLPQAYTGSHGDGDEYTYLSGAPFRAFMESLGRHRWEREQRYERQFAKRSGASLHGVTSRQTLTSGRRGLFGGLSMVLPPPVVTAALASESDHWSDNAPLLADARPFSRTKASKSPWLSSPAREPRVASSKQSSPKVDRAATTEEPSTGPKTPKKSPVVQTKARKSRADSRADEVSEEPTQARDALAIDVVRDNARTSLLAHKPKISAEPKQPKLGSGEIKTPSKASVAARTTKVESKEESVRGSKPLESQEPLFAPLKRTAPSHTQRASRRAEHLSFERSPLVNTLRDISPALPLRVQSALGAVLSDPSINSQRSDEMVRSIIRKGGVPRAIQTLLEERLSPAASQPMEAAVSRAAPDSTKRLQPVLSRSPIVGELLNPAAAFIAQSSSDEQLESFGAPVRDRTAKATIQLNEQGSALSTPQELTSPMVRGPSVQPAPQSSWVAARSAYGTAPAGRAVRTLAPKVVSPVREEASVRSPHSRRNRLLAGGATLLIPSVSRPEEFEEASRGFEPIQSRRPGTSSARVERGGGQASRNTQIAERGEEPRQQVVAPSDAGKAIKRSAEQSPTERLSRLSRESPTHTTIDQSPSSTVWAAERGEEPRQQVVAPSDAGKAVKRSAEQSPTERLSRLSRESPTHTTIDQSPSSTVWAAERGDLPASSPVYRATSGLRPHIPFAVSRAMKKAPEGNRFVSVQVDRGELEASSLVRDRGVSSEPRRWDRTAHTDLSAKAGVPRAESPTGRVVRWPTTTKSRSIGAIQYSHVEQPSVYASTTTPQGESWYEAPSRRASGKVDRGDVTRVQRSVGTQSDRYLDATRFLSGVSASVSTRSRGGELGGRVAPVSGSRQWRGQRVSPTSIVARGVIGQDDEAPIGIGVGQGQVATQSSTLASAIEGSSPRAFGQRGQRSSQIQGDRRVSLASASPSLMQTLGDVSRGDQSTGAPPWAERALGGPAIPGNGDLIQSLARASSSEDVVRIIMDRGEALSSATVLPSTTLEVVRQIQSEAKAEIPRQRELERRSVASEKAPTMSGISPSGGRNYRPARRVSAWTGKPRQSVHGASGIGDDRIMKLAKRLKGLVLLAENNRRDEARQQVRLAANEAPKAAASGSGQSGGATPGQLEALIQEVVQAVGRELEMRRERTQEESDGWW